MSLRLFIILLVCFPSLQLLSQVSGYVVDAEREALPFATISTPDGKMGTTANGEGYFSFTPPAGIDSLTVSALGFAQRRVAISNTAPLTIVLEPTANVLEDVVVTGTMKAVSRSASPVPVEVFTAQFFRANPTPSVFESLQTVNGVRPQLNCAVCNTGDIHINGLEGPYTMVLIDGMPIVSGLSTVYGLTGIPQSLIERVEVVKGPASTLYGSEAVGGLINVITRSPEDAPLFSADVMASGWGEVNVDVGGRLSAGAGLDGLIGVNYFNYQNPIDNNDDGFTDLTLQDRISVFSKWSLARKADRVFSLAGRYVYEDRWGGQMNWTRADRGGDQVYGESIYTNRWETFGTYQLPIPGERVMLQFSTNGHYQDSWYGETEYRASQYVGFGQLTWTKTLGPHELLLGGGYRYTYYDDNTPATAEVSRVHLPGAFVQDELRLNRRNVLLLGLRYDYNSRHGSILTPRLNYKWNSDHQDVVRISIGNGYRVANVFTEDHAALTGAREVIFADELAPETSWNANVNYTKKYFLDGGTVVGLDASSWYTHFGNRILPDYDTDPNAIIYANLNGTAVSRGASLSGDLSWNGGTTLNVGVTAQDVFTEEEGERDRQPLTESFMGVWQLGVPVLRYQLRIDYTGNVYGPMELPTLGPLDERPDRSPWFSTQNIQLTKTFRNGMEIYGGVKNLLDYTPPANSIARPFDPFDRGVDFAADGSVIPTASNPNALTFDPTYVYASNQGRRWFLGWRWSLAR
jgi:outer membrane receptor for ferrienterochelin and colicins